MGILHSLERSTGSDNPWSDIVIELKPMSDNMGLGLVKMIKGLT